ncbi:MAG: hypothetical protein JXA07_02335 [Spirochaetes bacterium]|nr:hypothetical protein [Spirochaetota bacterium]
MYLFKIPAINVIAVLHLWFVTLFCGLFLVKSIIELYPFIKKDDIAFHHAMITLHYWVDNLLEFPILIGIVATGISMLFLVDRITQLHIIKVSFIGLFLLVGSVCMINVNKRYKLLMRGGTNEELLQLSEKIIVSAGSAGILLLIPGLVLGFRLAYNRVLTSIYGG